MTLAIIGGTGLTQLQDLTISRKSKLETPYGAPSAEYVHGVINGHEIIFLARHGNPHTIAPHMINYRANIWGLQQLDVKQIIAVAAVGGLTRNMQPAHIAIPDQIIDYTYGRKHTFFEDTLTAVTHIDFSYPYSDNLRQSLISAASACNLPVSTTGTYGCTQGPRLESAAEIRRMINDGCDLVGMTGMPEAALARELGIEYAALAVVANWGAGIVEGEITMAEIEQHLQTGMANTMRILQMVLQ